jgi:hypothetical protein
MWHTGRMAQDVCPVVSGDDRARLEALVADRNRPHKHVLRARIILHSAARLSVAEMARRAGVGRSAVCGIGAVFAYMLELIGIDRVSRLAREEPAALHRRLVEFNAREQLARRAPTPEEVADWVHQARTLSDRLDGDGGVGGSHG